MLWGGLRKLAVKIGITCNRVGYENRLSMAYVNALLAADALPLLIPVCGNPAMFGEMLSAFDGLLLSGGGDPDASLYGEEAQPRQGYVQPDRDRMEVVLAGLALKQKLPVLGICRGAQIMALAAGGKLLQDLDGVEKVQHDQKAPRNYPIHQVKVAADSLLCRITEKDSIRVNSLHHQAIRYPGPQLRISAVAKDGVIEAVEMPGHPFALGVQWHPEWLLRTQPHAAALFKAFVRAAREQC